jgi:predicted nucleic acid-binding protein
MGRIVIDASIAASWCFREEATDYTEAALNAVAGSTEAIAPRLWAYEIRNCILTGVRRGRITQPNAEEFLKSLSDLNIALSDPISYDHVFSLAIQYKLTVYDAAYLDLAIKDSLAVASLDKDLLRAAEQAGLALFKT